MGEGGREGGFVFSWAFAQAIVLWDSLLSYKLSILLWPCALSTSWSSESLLGQMGDGGGRSREWDVRQAQHRVGGGDEERWSGESLGQAQEAVMEGQLTAPAWRV